LQLAFVGYQLQLMWLSFVHQRFSLAVVAVGSALNSGGANVTGDGSQEVL
jgi:hypothetical protein